MPRPASKNLLLTGLPGCGKTTVLLRAIAQLEDLRLAGFYTEEIREHGRRLGFKVAGLGGGSGVLAHADLKTGVQVGRYGVDLEAFNPLVQAEFGKATGEVDLFVIDEIGKVDLFVIDEIGRMECHSPVFVAAVGKVLDSNVPVLATIALKGGGFVGEVKARRDVELLTVSAGNRDRLASEIAERIRRVSAGRHSRGE
jgi:nucleoside-triphosphatase